MHGCLQGGEGGREEEGDLGTTRWFAKSLRRGPDT